MCSKAFVIILLSQFYGRKLLTSYMEPVLLKCQRVCITPGFTPAKLSREPVVDIVRPDGFTPSPRVLCLTPLERNYARFKVSEKPVLVDCLRIELSVLMKSN